MSENRALHQTNETNACAQCEWPWKIGRTNLTGRVCSAAMLLQKHSTYEQIRESVRMNYWVQSHHPARTSSGWMFELWISDGSEWFFAVSFVYPKFAVFARSKQFILMPVTVKFRLDFLVCDLQGHLLRHLARVDPIFACNKDHEAMKNCRDWDFSLSAAHVRKMWRTAERRFVQHDGHVCLRNPFSPFLFGIPSIHSTWEPQHAPSAVHDGCIMPAKDRVEVSKIWSTGYWLWSRLSSIRVYTRQLQVNE